MKKHYFGGLVVVAIASGALAAETAPKPAAAQTDGRCVHNCAGYANCKGNGNNTCKGKNECANTGLVPKECSAKPDAGSCAKVSDQKKNTMCQWLKS